MRTLATIGFALFSTLSIGSMISTVSHANPTFLSADQAFQFSSESLSKKSIQLKWDIAPHYYLYHDQFIVRTHNQKLELKLPAGEQKQDPTFGLTEVHYNQVTAELSVQPNTEYKIQWQGCSKDGLCYPVQRQTLVTDREGLIPQSNPSRLNNALNPLNSGSLSNSTQLTSTTSATELTTQDQQAFNKDFNEPNKKTQAIDDTSSLQWNDDRSFFNLLAEDSLFLNLLIFFGLGILLAFLPCSLPLIPILSTLIIQRQSGLKAAAVAANFIVSMALVYSLMGIVVAEIGYSFQRWFQSPLVLSIFAAMFVIFALNLFGLFNLSLPHAITQKLNQFQNRQQAGTFIGTVIMGALSALIIGPCMSAPLAGALLFVSQSQSAFLGGLYLFILGLGLGLPLFIASVFGSRLLPKPGTWMNHLKVGFGFMMLGMAIYFIQPLLSNMLYYALISLIFLSLMLYLIKVLIQSQTLFLKILFGILICMSLISSIWHAQQSYQNTQIQKNDVNQLIWKRVSTPNELELALAEAKRLGQSSLIDVYADWCVACQPIEKEVFPRSDVQTALKDVYLIKLDLSEYDASQDLILKKHEILGPPTLLFMSSQAQEMRALRLTGTFKADSLLKQMSRLKDEH